MRLFEDPGLPRAASAWPTPYRYEFRGAGEPVEPDVRRCIERAGAHGLIDDLDRCDRFYLVWHDSEIVSYGAVFLASPQRSVLGLAPDAVLIGGCATRPAHRGRSLYRLALNDTTLAMRELGRAKVFVEVRPENAPSIRGIQAAGLVERGEVDSKILLGTLVWRGGRLHRLRRGQSA